MKYNINEVLTAYLTCALWSSTDDAGEPLEAHFTSDDLAPEAVESASDDITSFLTEVERQGADRSAWSDEQLGHDFLLTRNGHGAGFWDRGYGEAGRILTEIAKTFGTSDAYVGDDGKVYLT